MERKLTPYVLRCQLVEEALKVRVEVHVYEGEGHIFQKGLSLRDMEVRREAWFREDLVEA
jgi:hypothetical protein